MGGTSKLRRKVPGRCVRGEICTVGELLRQEAEHVWSIDRSEVTDNVYRLENGDLVLRPEHHDLSGCPPDEADQCTPILLDCFDRGGWFHGLFDRSQLVAVVVLDSERIGKRSDQLQLKFLHVSRPYRKSGLGGRLFELVKATARERGAKQLYISAMPSENTINFYLRPGCVVAAEVDPHLFELEPGDTHLESYV